MYILYLHVICTYTIIQIYTYTYTYYKAQPWYEYLMSILKAVDTGILSLYLPCFGHPPNSLDPSDKAFDSYTPGRGEILLDFLGCKLSQLIFKVVIWWYQNVLFSNLSNPNFRLNKKSTKGYTPENWRRLHPKIPFYKAPELWRLKVWNFRGVDLFVGFASKAQIPWRLFSQKPL